MPIFMKYEGIDGNATARGYERWIELHSFQFSVRRTISTPTGRAANREASAPTVSEVVITKDMDRASPPLLEQALVGAIGRTVTLTATRTGQELEEYMTYKIQGMLVSGHSIHTSSSAAPSETLHLNFDKISWTVWPTKADGRTATPITVGYDIGKATGM